MPSYVASRACAAVESIPGGKQEAEAEAEAEAVPLTAALFSSMEHLQLVSLCLPSCALAFNYSQLRVIKTL